MPSESGWQFLAEFVKANSVFLVVNPENAAPSRLKNRAAGGSAPPEPPHAPPLSVTISSFMVLGGISLFSDVFLSYGSLP